MLLEHGCELFGAVRVNQRQRAVSEVSVPLRECHLHRVGVERQTEHTCLIQEPPQNAATLRTAHEPLDVIDLDTRLKTSARLLFSAGFVLTSEVGRVVILQTHAADAMSVPTLSVAQILLNGSPA